MVNIVGKGSDGKSYAITINEIVEPPVDPPVEPPSWVLPHYPTEFNAISLSPTVFLPIDGVDIPRENGKAVIYTIPSIYSQVNKWGIDILVHGYSGSELIYKDREKGPSSTTISSQSPISGDYVISVHGAKADIIRQFAIDEPGKALFTLVKRDTPTPPVVIPGKAWITTWGMVYSDSPRVDFGQLPIEIDELALAFVFNKGVISGYSQLGLNSLKNQLQAFLAAKPTRIISASLGGGGNNVDVSDPIGFVRNLKFIESQLGIKWGGLNCDIENNSFVTSFPNLLKIYRQFISERPGFKSSWSPNGSYVDKYIAALKDNLDVLKNGWIAQQFYDSPVSVVAAKGRIQQMLDAGIPIESIGIGMMIEDNNSSRWTLKQCIDNTTTLVKEFPGIVHVNNWEASRQQLQPWATAMKGIIE